MNKIEIEYIGKVSFDFEIKGKIEPLNKPVYKIKIGIFESEDIFIEEIERCVSVFSLFFSMNIPITNDLFNKVVKNT